MSVNQDLQDAALRHAIYSERYGRGLAKRIVSLLNAADADLSDQLERRLNRIADGMDTGPATTRRLTEIIEALRTLNDGVYRKLYAALKGELTDLAAFEIENQAASLERIVPVSIAATQPTPAFLKTLVETTPIDGFLLKSHVEHMSSNRLGRVEQALRVGMVQGETVDQLVRRVRGTKAKGYKDGILQISRRSAETLCITANATIANAARMTVYRENSNVIQKVKWLATLDSRTSPTCQSRDGKLYEIDKPHPTPPAHPRCRSVLMPITVPFRDLGVDADDYTPAQRASMDGQVPGNTTFGDWLKKQPRERVVEIYGQERADLFISGKVSFADMYREDGSFYTLAELRQKARSAKPDTKPKTSKPEPKPVEVKPATRSLDEINSNHDRDMRTYTLDKGRKDGKEHLTAYDAKTGVAFDPITDGKKGSVEFPPWLVDKLRDRENEIVLHHNHPSSNSFSAADLSVVHEFPGAKSIWAHGHNGSSYFAEAGPRKMSSQTYKFHRTEVTRWMQRKVNTREITTEDANLVFFHVVTRLIERRGYLVYRANLQGPTLEAYNRTEPLIEAFLKTFNGYNE